MCMARLGWLCQQKYMILVKMSMPRDHQPFVEARWRTFYSLIQRYPDPDGEPFLSKVAAFHGISKDTVLLGNGASELFSVLARRYENKRVIVIHPTFAEYERTLKAAHAEVVSVVVEDVLHYASADGTFIRGNGGGRCINHLYTE